MPGCVVVATESWDGGDAECSLNVAASNNAVINEECSMAAIGDDLQDAETASNTTMCSCDCDKNDRLGLLDAILGYFESPVN